ncbi:MAG: class I SAM-dependent methyltransferase [Bacteroidota bacterium]|nr:class I SAM-dependent methyltransferase [Bacteroidota bacterium]
MRACPVCTTAANVALYHRVDGFDYVRCSKCELIFIDKVAPTSELYTAYDGGWWKALRRRITAPFRTFDQIPNLRKSLDRARQIFDFVAGYAPASATQPNFLDIGCNKGFLLVQALEHGYNVFGIELVAVLLEPFRRKYPRFAGQVEAGRFMDVQRNFSDEMFEVITAIDVIEHLEDPNIDFNTIFRLLKPGGVFVIQTPDGDSPQAHRDQASWGALKPLEHLQLFSRKNLGLFAARHGFASTSFFEPFEEADGNFVAVMKKAD